MRLLGHGIDLVPVPRIEKMLADHSERFLERCFTPAEQAYAAESKRRAEHLAARFAAKEAVLKALGTGLSSGVTWTDIEVTRGDNGAPGVHLSGAALAAARSRGITQWLVSLTHTDDHAAASVIAFAD